MADRYTSIRSTQIKDANVTSTELASNAVTTVKVTDAAVTNAKLNADVAGNGIAGGAGSALAVQAQDSTITVGASGIKVGADSINATHIDETGNYAFSGTMTITTSPTGANDIANKSYVDTVSSGLEPKAQVQLATTGNIILSGEQTIDGILTSASRILVKDQTVASENGIYITAAGAWLRASDMAASSAASGVHMFVDNGTVNATAGFICTTNAGSDVVGTNNLTFEKYTSLGQVNDGNGLSKIGNTLNVNVTGACEIDTDAIDVANSGIDAIRLAANAVTTAKILDANVTEAKLATSVAGNGISGGAGSALALDLSELTAAVVDVAADSVAILDATDSSTKIETVADLVSAMAGSGLTAASGVLSVDSLTGNVIESDFVKVVVDGTTASQTVIPTVSGTAPVLANSVQVHLDGVLQFEGVAKDYQVNLSTGVVTFETPLAAGQLVQVHAVLDNA